MHGCIINYVQLTINSLPGGGLLSHLPTATLHYLDLGGVQATCLSDYQGSEYLWSNIKKLYASNCGLQTVAGVSSLISCRYLYLDGNALQKEELLRLAEELPLTEIVALDISRNPGMDDEVEEALLASPALAACEYFNGQRVDPHR